jgi:hypothetical protein
MRNACTIFVVKLQDKEQIERPSCEDYVKTDLWEI